MKKRRCLMCGKSYLQQTVVRMICTAVIKMLSFSPSGNSYQRSIKNRNTQHQNRQKPCVFLQQLCEKLGIEAEFIHERAEIAGKMPEYREKFDVSCARAVANMSLLSEYCIPFVKPGGIFAAMKGPSEDISSAENAVRLLGGEFSCEKTYELEGEQRKIVIVKKISQTPTKYPRNSSQIKKRSL